MIRTCIYRTLYEQLSLKLDFATIAASCLLLLIAQPSSLLFHLLSKVLKGGPCLRSLVIVLQQSTRILRSQITCLGTPRTAHLPVRSIVPEAPLWA
jgi:hypothetical protein